MSEAGINQGFCLRGTVILLERPYLQHQDLALIDDFNESLNQERPGGE